MPLFQASSASIWYEQTGSGPDVVWVGGGGTRGLDFHMYHTPHFDAGFRSTVFDNRGVGQTRTEAPTPWQIEDFARDLAELAREVCPGPAAFVGSSLGAAIVQQLAIDSPGVMACGVVMGTGAWSTGWGWDYQEAEIEFRKAGGRLDGMMAVTHYASMLYPARVLGDRELWPKIRAYLLDWIESDTNEESLVPQWDVSLRFDQRAALPNVRVPFHVLAFSEDVQAPPQDGEELAGLIPGAEFHLMEGMGHGSWYGHAQDQLNPYVEAILRRYLPG